jgi:YD repeat-containing protein
VDPGLVLHSRKAPSTYRFPLRLTGVTARVDEADGSVVYEDENGEPVFRTPRPWMMDSAYGDRVPGQTSLGASYHLVVGADGGQVLELRLSQTWLQDPARVYPVKVDPTLQSSSVGNGHPFFYSDTSYASHNPYSAYTSDGGLYIGADNHGHRYRAVLQFGGGAKITPGDGLHYVHSATFGVHQAYAFNCYREVYAKRVTESWVRHEDSWAPQLGPPHDPHGGAALTAGHACPPGNVGWLHFDVTETARRWEHDPAIDNHGLALLGSFTWNDTARGFYSQNHWDASIHPYMSIIWENTAPTAGSGGSPADGAVLTSKPVLFARYDDADGDWGVLRWNLDQRQPDGVSWSTVFDFVSGNPWEPGATASQGIDQHLSGGVYRWRVQAGDGSSRGDWSGYQTFTIEVPPAAPSISSSTHPSQEAWYSNPSAALSWTEPGSHAGINGYSYALDRSAGTVPDTTSEGTSRTASFGGLVDGVHYFHVRARNNAGQWGDTAHFAVRVHTASPAGPSVTSSTHPDPNVTYPNSAPTLNWTAPASMSGIDGYSYTLDTTPSTVPDTVSEGAGTTKSYSGLADQTHYFHVRARTGAGVWGATTHFTVRVQTDQTPPTPVVGLRSTSHLLKLNSDNRTLTMTWAASTDTQSGMAGYDVLFNTSATSRTGTPARVVMPGASRAGLVDGAWYAHVRPVDNAGNRGVWVTAGPYLIGEATLTEALPGPVAQSSETGLEQFAPMEDHDTGNGRSHVHLRTGNLVSTLDLATVPGHGLNTVVRLTHNNSAAHRDAGVGRGWSLSVTDLDAGLDGMLGDVADGAVTDLDINRDLALADVTSAGGLVQDAAYTGAAVTGRVLEFTDGDGTVHRFVRDGGVGSRWSGPPGVDLRVREDFTEDAAKLRTVKAYELIRPDGVVYRAENVRTTLGLTVPVWRVVSATDRNGNRLSYTHASFGPPGVNRTRLTEIRHSRTGNDPVVTFAYAPYNATQAASGVDDGGVLRSMTTLPGHTSGGRSWERRTTFTITPDKPNSTDDHRLVLVTENAHNAPAGVDLAQRSTAFDYHDGTNLLRSVSAPTAGATVAATVAKTQFTYTTLPGEARPRLTGITDRAGKPWSYSYTVRPDGWTRTVATRPVRGSETTALTYEIDARGAVDGSEDPRIAGGNLRTVTNAGTGTPNRPVTTRYEWYANKLTASIDGVGVRTSMTYNDLGLLTSITQPPPNTPGTTDLPVNAPTTPVTSRLSYRDPHTGSDKAAYPSCEAPPAGSKAVSRDMWCSAVAELVKTVFAEGSDEQRVTDFGYHGGGDLASVTERVRSDGVADLNDRTTTFDYFRRGGLRKIDGPRTDVDDITCYGQAALAGATGDCASPPADADLHGDYDRTGMPRVLRDAAGKPGSTADLGVST